MLKKCPSKVKTRAKTTKKAIKRTKKLDNPLEELYRLTAESLNKESIGEATYGVQPIPCWEKPNWGKIHVNIYRSITGCGLGVIYGLSHFRISDREAKGVDHKQALENIMKASSGFGAIIGTLGEAYYKDSHQAILDLGFEQIAEYPNRNHGEKYTQRLYMLRIKK